MHYVSSNALEFGHNCSVGESLQSTVGSAIQSTASPPFQPHVVEDEYGIFIRFGGTPSTRAELHEAMVEVYRDSDGKIVAIDIVYDDEGK